MVFYLIDNFVNLDLTAKFIKLETVAVFFLYRQKIDDKTYITSITCQISVLKC